MKSLLPIILFILVGVVRAGESTDTATVGTPSAKIVQTEAYLVDESEDNNDAFVCKLEILTKASVYTQGDHLRGRLSDIKRLIRLRLRNDMSMMSNEELDLEELWAKYAPGSDEAKRRGYVSCEIWTVGEEKFPIAIHVECELEGLGVYKVAPMLQKLEGIAERSLGYVSRSGLYEYLDGTLRQQISNIAAKFLRLRDGWQCSY